MKKSTLLVALLPAVMAGLAYFPFKNKEKNFHTPAELAAFKQHFSNQKSLLTDPHSQIPIDSNVIFVTAKTCGGCHGFDPNMFALVGSDGKDVNMYDDWRSSMMANSAKDPFWRAKVTHEILVNPAHSLALQDKCTTCHAPGGHFQAHLKDKKDYYTLADMYADTLGLDGVTCQICHAQSPDAAIGNQHSGNVPFDTNHIRVAYGPFEFPFAPPMHNFVGITPLYGEHMEDAGLCAGCHTLITSTVDLNGQPTGGTFVEQATYHEWLNSKYDEQHENISCQNCHVPKLLDEVIIAANYQSLTPKFPIGLHELTGANVTMLRLLKENRSKLSINASAEHFDSTIASTLRQLQEKTLEMTLKPEVLQGDTLAFDLKLLNKAGHKFPSGYPARRAWVEFLAVLENGDTLFHSGRFDPSDFSLPDEDPNFEPHHDIINSPNQVQIYEMVQGDVTGSFTTVLERGHAQLKDNRLTPIGFLTSDPVYDTVKIVGHAFDDVDFNIDENGNEGSGTDIVHFRVPTKGKDGRISLTARVWYQSLPPKFVNPVFGFSSPEIDSFKLMFNAADRWPILVGEVVLDSIEISSVSTQNIGNQEFAKIFPNPAADGKIKVKTQPGVRFQQLKVYDLGGKLLFSGKQPEAVLAGRKGVVLVVVETNRGRKIEKVLL